MGVSVVTVVYNGENIIEGTINSVFQQISHFSDIEYILIDGASTDNTLSIINQNKLRFQNLNIPYICVSESDNGIFDAMNKGLQLAKNDWIIFMNAGDFFFENDTIFNVFNRDVSGADLIYGDVLLYDHKEEYKFISKTNKYKINLNAICHQSVFIRREKHKPFNIKYRLAADHDIIYALIKTGNVIYLDFPISKILIGGVSSDLKRTRLEKLQISMNNGESLDRMLACIIFCYNFLKSISKKLILKIFPQSFFSAIRSLKNKLEQL